MLMKENTTMKEISDDSTVPLLGEARKSGRKLKV